MTGSRDSTQRRADDSDDDTPFTPASARFVHALVLVSVWVVAGPASASLSDHQLQRLAISVPTRELGEQRGLAF
jgi:hypothetical protein